MNSTVPRKSLRDRSLTQYIILAVTVALLLLLWPMPDLHRLFRYGMDLLHAPFFAIFAFILDQKRRGLQKESIYKLLISWVILLILAVSMEAAQSWVGRDSNWHDGLSNILGITAGILFSFSFVAGKFWIKWIARFFGILMILSGSLYGIRGMLDTLKAHHSFPLLADFESNAELLRWESRNAILVCSRKFSSAGIFSGKLTLVPGRYPGSSIELPSKSWSNYQNIEMDITWPVPDDSASANHRTPKHLPLRIKLEDNGPNKMVSDRFESTVLLYPGKNRIQIPLRKVIHGPKDRLLDLKSMSRLSLFVSDLKSPQVIYLDQIRLD